MAFIFNVQVLEYDGLLLGVFGIRHYEEVHKRYPPPESDTRSEAAVSYQLSYH